MPLLQEPSSPFRRIHRRAAKHLSRLRIGLKLHGMRNEARRLVDTVSDPAAKKAFAQEMQAFSKLLTRHIHSVKQKPRWGNVLPPTTDQIILYDQLSPPKDATIPLNQLAVLKFNGGLGTSMGMQGAKSALEVKNDLTFLDLTIKQIAHVNASHSVDVPLVLMTSFNTHEDTLRIIQKYESKQVRITSFMQSKYPRIMKDNLLPCPEIGKDDKGAWYPPGHGNLYDSIYRSGVLDRLLKDGKRYIFVSNSDNLGAVVDTKILHYMVDTEADFLMEVTDKTRADVKGGTLINYDGALRLLEMAQVPSEESDLRQFKIFNTNNLWINLQALKKIMDQGGMELDIIESSKVTEDGRSILQLETAAGAAIRYFSNARGINVPRSRFLPVKNCSDLLLIKSDIYSLEQGRPVLSEDRIFGTTPVIKLDDHFKKIRDFQLRFRAIPTIVDLDHLTVSGNVHFGRDITLRGTVIIVANEGQRIDIPDGCILENRLVSGNLSMTEL